MTPTLPRFVALCGNPLAGKTTAAEILRDNFGYQIVDDGLALRLIAMHHLGLTADQVFTQAGKLEVVTINGRDWVVRKVLGEIGNAFEEKFGADVIPEMAMRALPSIGRFVFASTRREQCGYYRSMGALVLEIENSLAGASIYEFDRYNRAHAHATVANEGLAQGMSKLDAWNDLADRLRVELRTIRPSQ